MSNSLKPAAGTGEKTPQPQNLIQFVAEAIYEASLRRTLKGINSQQQLAA